MPRRAFVSRLLAMGLAPAAAGSVLAMCVGVAIVSYLAASVFLHETHLRYPALYIGFAMALAQMAQREPLEARP